MSENRLVVEIGAFENRSQNAPSTDDARLEKPAVVRFISALGQRAAVELLYERKLIEAETSREKLTELGLHVGDRCSISLRLPRIYAKADADRTKGAEGQRGMRLRVRRRPRAA